MYLFFISNNPNLNICPELDVVQFGPFYITNCKSQDQHIATLLTTLRNVLLPVITDLGSSASSNAYTTFFKDIAYAPFVRDILSNIANGTSVIPEAGAESLAPRFICVDDRDQVTFDLKGKQEDVYDFCRSRAESPALILLAASMIFLCPTFFTFPAVPVQSSASCYSVDPHRNQFVQKGRNLVEYQIWSVMHEMVHYYTFAKTARLVDEYGINDCLALLGRDAIVNPESYSYYVASKRTARFLLFCKSDASLFADGVRQTYDWVARTSQL